ncbi:MAG: glutathione S-transferase family protein [Proteobacteria bacterium]|jgi:glutathione S-transferase|nr:glutathione S-transferase family protein [Pseudomonadota bacterium]MDA1239012.1 glutathione S-transferase family protein [Pseudomonadota bacterium]
MMEFYYSKNSAAFAVTILLEDTKEPYIPHELDFSKGDQTSEGYLKINPKGRVPSVVTPKGILTETPAILQYIAHLHPDLKLLPEDPFCSAQALAFNLYISSTVHVAHAHKHRGSRWATEDHALHNMSAKVTENMTECAKNIEENYLIGPWVSGDNYSICDPYLALAFRWFKDDGVNLSAFPRIIEHDILIRKRPSMQRAMAIHASI